VVQFMTQEQITRNVDLLELQMRKASKELDFIAAAQLRDDLFAMRKLLSEKEKASKED